MESSLNAMARKVMDGRLTRRSFMQYAIGAGLSVAAASSVLMRAEAATPKRGGVARFGLSAGDPADSFSVSYAPPRYMIMLKRAVQSSLTEVDLDGKVKGDLAESWESSPDAKQWVFKIRDGVEFHNGKTLTVDDVVATLNFHRDEKNASTMRAQLANISDVKADGKNVVVTLASGNADVPYLMAEYSLGIFPATADGVDWQAGIGTGGYAIEEFKPGIQAHLKRNANYYKADRANFDEVFMVSINDKTARQSALMSGQVDVVDGIDPKTAQVVAAQQSARLIEVKGSGHYDFTMNLKVAPFDNNNVRLALKECLDREQFVKVILRGHGVVGNDNPISSSYPYFAADIPQRTYDPEKAKYYLKQAGMENLKVDLHGAPSSFEGAIEACSLYAENAKKAGIEITVVREPDDGYYDQVWGVKGWAATWWGGRATEDLIFSLGYIKGALWNGAHYEDDKFSALLIEAAAMLDTKKRAEMYKDLQLMVRDNAGATIPAFVNWLDGASNKIGMPDIPSANFPLSDARAAERWWFV
jgi:peptide/nickel transport system substrate-binding protein